MDRYAHKGDVQAGAQTAVLIQGIDKQRRSRHLKQQLLQGGQAQVLVMLDFGKIIHHADGAEGQSHAIDIENGIVLHGADVHQQANQCSRNEHQPAHHRGACLLVVPGGADFTQLDSGLQCTKHGQQEIAENTGQDGADQGSNQDSGHYFFLLCNQFSLFISASTICSMRMPWLPFTRTKSPGFRVNCSSLISLSLSV